MIDTSKQYTYKGKPVRIYADGSDTFSNVIHGAYSEEKGWSLRTFLEDDLVEAWEPKEDEVVLCWNKYDSLPSIRKYSSRVYWDYVAPFTGTLPESFKGLV